MKFGLRLKSDLYPEWASMYIDYAALKKRLKSKDREEWDDTDEQAFIAALQDELSKIYKFQENTMTAIWDQLREHEQMVRELMDSRPDRSYGDEEQGDDDDQDDLDDRDAKFADIEADLETLIWQTHEISKYTQINFTGFQKITKKHDKMTGFPLKTQFISKYLERLPFHKLQYDELIIELSRLYNLVRTRGNPVVGDSAAGGGQSDFVRQTTKYWVHPDNLMCVALVLELLGRLELEHSNLKLAILKHLPVLVFDPDKTYDPEDAAISSVYFDNEDLELYLGRLEKTEGAQAIRLRWYGGMQTKQIFVERKTHREDWTGEKSIKARFPIKEDQVNDYLAGKLDLTPIFEAKRKTAKKQSDVDNNIRLAREVQETVREKHLVPVMRTFYDRTAFQLPGDARVRISLDTNLTLIREDNWDDTQRSGNNWRRMDIGVDFPFSQLPPSDVHRFPYGVLEVKLQTQAGQEPPEWAKELVSSHLVEAVPKFSKFIHGCATLLDTRVPLVPFWLPQMDVSILKPETPSKKAAIISRPIGSRNSLSAGSSNKISPTSSEGQGQHPSTLPGYTEPLSDDEDDAEDIRPTKLAKDELVSTGLPEDKKDALLEAKQHRERSAQTEGHLSAPMATSSTAPADAKPASGSVMPYPKLTPQNLERLMKAKYEQETPETVAEDARATIPTNPDRPAEPASASAVTVRKVDYISSFSAPQGKLVAVPVRIEPKVYFANERTFLAWLEFSVLISAIGIALMNFAKPSDPIGLAAGISFTIIALLCIGYSGVMYVFRAIKIRNRVATHYNDSFGPTAICVVLLAATGINFIWRLAEPKYNK